MNPTLKKVLVGITLIALSVVVLKRLWVRHQVEIHANQVVVSLDWEEIKTLTKRRSISDLALASQLQQVGVQAVVMSTQRLEQLVSDEGQNQFQTNVLRLSVPEHTPYVARYLIRRGVQDLSFGRDSRGFYLKRSHAIFEPLRDVDAGFAWPLINQIVSTEKVQVVLRWMNDPWLNPSYLQEEFDELYRAMRFQPLGFFWGHDEAPGGVNAEPYWQSFANATAMHHFLFEFKPSKAAVRLAFQFPHTVFRSHSLPAAEAKDLKPEQVASRMKRAIDERKIQFIYLHASPTDSYASYLGLNSMVQAAVLHRGFELAIPNRTLLLKPPTKIIAYLQSLLGILLVCVIPLLALWCVRETWLLNRKKPLFPIIKSIAIYWGIILLGGLLVAVCCWNSYTLLQLTPFRGVKVGFILPWFLCLGIIFSNAELKKFLSESIKRWEIFAVFLLMAIIGYLVIRTGNSSAAWQSGFEQPLRDGLEEIFRVRPRFKEFAIGYPLLFMGLYFVTKYPKDLIGRFCLWLGLIAPLSMLNTFCHLHSPLWTQVTRSFYGVFLGGFIALCLIALWERLPKIRVNAD